MTRAPHRPPLAYRDIDDVARALREAGGRFSAARRGVLEALFAADAPLPADAVAPGLDRASVYRALEYLEELGVVRHVHLGHGPGLYALTGGGPGTATEPIALYTHTIILQHLRFGYGSALSVVVFIITFVLALIYIRGLGLRLSGDER